MTTFTLQPSSTTGADVYVDLASSTANFLTDPKCYVGANQIGDDYRSFMRLDLTSIAGAETQIDSATLNLQGVLSGTAYPVYMALTTQTGWTRNGVTWDKYDGTHNWLVSGGDFTLDGAAVFSATNGAVTIDGDDFKAIAQAAVAGSGYIDVEFIAARGQPDDSLWYFKSSRDTTPANRPLLTILYHNSPLALKSGGGPTTGAELDPEDIIQGIPFDLNPTTVVLTHKGF